MSASTKTQTGFLSRRRFFRWASSLTAAVGAAPLFSSARTLDSAMSSATGSAMASPLPDGEDYYAKLGVPTIINAAGTYTTLDGCLHASGGSGRGAESRDASCAPA